LPWDPSRCELVGPHRHRGDFGCRVVESVAYRWNVDASDRYARLWKAATVAADRWVRRVHGSSVRLPRRVAVVWSVQQRGVWHVHEALPFETHVERQWSRVVVDYVDRFAARYGWGNLDRNPLRESARVHGGAAAARYLARNAASYLAENTRGESMLPGRLLRSYVSRRLTSRTGSTMRNLRRVRYLYVCITLGLPLPEWPADQLEVVWRLMVGGEVSPSGP
jgi:hypothetical protein